MVYWNFHEVCEIQKNALRDEVRKWHQLSLMLLTVIERNCSASPFDGLHTAYLQQQYFQKHFYFVVSCAFCVYMHVHV